MIVTTDELFQAFQVYAVIHLGSKLMLKLLVITGKRLNAERHMILAAHYDHKHNSPLAGCSDGFCHKLSSI